MGRNGRRFEPQWVGIGTAIGAGLGVVFNSIPIGAGLGIVLGVALGFLIANCGLGEDKN